MISGTLFHFICSIFNRLKSLSVKIAKPSITRGVLDFDSIESEYSSALIVPISIFFKL